MAHVTPLPGNVYAAAMDRQLALHRRRIEKMYNRHRALFAESIVAELLGAKEEPDPTAAWDVHWQRPGTRDVRIQVKCSGGFLPRFPNREAETPASWNVQAPTFGYQPHEDVDQRGLGPGHHCDVFVLARHTGSDITEGWLFAALPTHVVDDARTRGGRPRRNVTVRHLDSWDVELMPPDRLVEAVAEAAERKFARE